MTIMYLHARKEKKGKNKEKEEALATKLRWERVAASDDD